MRAFDPEHKYASSLTSLRLWLLILVSTGILAVLAACGPPGAPPGTRETVSAVQKDPSAPAAIDVRQVRRALSAVEAEDYLGDAVCGSCHKEIAAAHAKSAHAHTLRSVTLAEDGPLFRHATPLKDSRNHFKYATVVQENRCQLLAFNNSVEATLPADYAVGSGRHAVSFLNRDDRNGWVTLRLSYYPQARRWDFTAGQPPERPLSTPMGIELDGPKVTACLLCHTTVLRPGSLDTSSGGGPLYAESYPDVGASRLGVGCERCHGPGRAHVNAVTHADPAFRSIAAAKAAHQTFGMEDLGHASPEQINNLCGYCHRTPQNTDPRDPHNEMDIPRFEGVALARSACYQKSGTLSCVTCHDPHTDANPSLARNDAICLRCHTNQSVSSGHPAASSPAAAPVTCPVNSHSGCTSCHMPKVTIDLGPGVRYTNHWIKVWQGAKADPEDTDKK